MNAENRERCDMWTKPNTLQLIEEYKKWDLLYKANHPDRFVLHKRSEALAKICENLKPFKPNVTVIDIKKKLKVLNQQMALEKKKIALATNKQKFHSSLWCFKELEFLLSANDEVAPISSTDNTTEVDRKLQIEDQTVGLTPPKKKSRTNGDIADELREIATKSLELINTFVNKEEEEVEPTKEEHFCNMICAELKSLKSEENYDYVTTEIFNIVKKAKINERNIQPTIIIKQEMQ